MGARAAGRRLLLLPGLLACACLPLLACGEKPEAGTQGGRGGASASATEAAGPALDFSGDAETLQRVVLVSIDTLRADHVGCYGDATAQTPTLDGLAAAGVRFATAISPAPITLPSHTTLLTGLDPPQHGVRHNGLFRLQNGIPTLAERVQKAGLASAAFISAYVLDRQFGLNRGFDHYDDEIGLSDPGHTGPAIATRAANRTVDAALAWVAKAPERFLLFVHLYDPHRDYTPPEPYRTRFGEGHLYDAEVSFADAEVGRLLAGVASRWPSGTLVVVVSDHGESFGEHGEPTHSLTIYDATQHVPLIMAGPGVPSGRVVPQLVRLADVTPTLLDLLGLPPVDHGGESLRGLWEGVQEPPRVAWVETLATQFDFGWSPLLGVRTAAYKYIRAPHPELYDLEKDPKELHNLAAQQPERVRRLDALVSQRAVGLPIVPSTDLSPDQRAQLEALGYVTQGPRALREKLGVVGGADPKDEMHLLKSLFEGMHLFAQRRYAEALAKLSVMGDASMELAVLRGQAALGAGRLDVARKAAKAALGFAPGRGQPHTLLGQIEEAAGHPKKARAAFERSIQLEPSQGAAWLGLGRLAEAAGRTDEALTDYQRATRARIFESEAVWRQAALEIERGEADKARVLLASLPQAELRQPPAVLRLAQAEAAAGQGEMARIRVAGGLRAFPGDVSLLLLHARFLERDGKAGAALRARRDALAAHPDDLRAQQAVSRHLSRGGRDLDEALALAEAVLKTAGRTPHALDTLARVRLAQGRSSDALALVEEALPGQRGGTRTSLLLRRAEALAGLGRAEQARAALTAASEGVQGDVDLAGDLAWTQARVARLLQARKARASR